MAMTVAFRLAAITPASDEPARVLPPTTTCESFVMPYCSRSEANSISRSSRVTTIISSMYALASNTRSVRARTGMPPMGSMSLSLPSRVDEPAATITAVRNDFLTISCSFLYSAMELPHFPDCGMYSEIS